MRKLWMLALMPLLGGCYIETSTVYQPIFQPAGGVPEPSYIVVQNINPSYECRVLHESEVYPPIYRVVFGPGTQREGLNFIRDVCRRRPQSQ